MPDDEINYMEKHPPRCVKPHVGPPSTILLNYIRDDYGTNTTAFSILCECKNGVLKVLIPDEFGPIAIECPDCGKNRTIFDPIQHGYEGELKLNDGVQTDSPCQYKCPECEGLFFELASGFQYSGETDVLEEEDLNIKPEDLFGWYILAGECISCKSVNLIFDMECA